MTSAEQGCIHLYSGDGKGKTTAAMGLALRAVAAGWPVIIVQFLKDGTSGELQSLGQLPRVAIVSGKPYPGFASGYTDRQRQETRRLNDQRLREMFAQVRAITGPQLLVLDELVGAIEQGLADEALLLDFLDHRPCGVEIVLTGRHPSPDLAQRADYHSEIRKLKHPYDRGLVARKGVEQ